MGMAFISTSTIPLSLRSPSALETLLSFTVARPEAHTWRKWYLHWPLDSATHSEIIMWLNLEYSAKQKSFLLSGIEAVSVFMCIPKSRDGILLTPLIYELDHWHQLGSSWASGPLSFQFNHLKTGTLWDVGAGINIERHRCLLNDRLQLWTPLVHGFEWKRMTQSLVS